MNQKPVTIKEIAKRLNVSVSTVSRALHDHHSIGLRTKMQVNKLAKELNYEPNQAAISFKKGKTLTLGVILPTFSEDFFSIAINAIEEVAMQNGYTVLIGQSHDEADREVQLIETMRRQRVDGLLVSMAKNTNNYTHFDQLANYGIPVVFFDRVPTGTSEYAVSCNLKNSSQKLVSFLVERGHRTIGFIRGPHSMAASEERLEGYKEGLRQNNIMFDPDYVTVTDLDKHNTRIAMEQLLRQEPRPTAVIAFNDYVALEALKYARDAGLKVNEDIVFVSYANLPITLYLDKPPLASVEQFPYEQAEKATAVLLNLIAQKTEALPPEKHIILESQVIVNYEPGELPFLQ